VKLNGWQRIGVVLSGVWLVGVSAIAGLSWADRQQTSGAFVRRIVVESPRAEAIPPMTKQASQSSPDLPEGFAKFLRDKGHNETSYAYEFLVGPFIVALFLPVVLVWILAYAVVTLVRWVAVGFRRK
jgi:hypothetical protein